MVATASSAAADISSHVESVHPQFSATTESVHNSVGVAVRLGSDGSTGNRSESPASEEPEESCAPMDLSSGGGGSGGGVASQLATPTFMMAAAAAAVHGSSTPTSLANSLLNAQRLAEFVRAQQQLKKEESATPPPMVPRKRAWPELQLDLSAMVSEKLKKKEECSPSSPTESTGSSGGGAATPSSNKEVKKRRLDQLLSKKFSVNDSPPPSSVAVTPPQEQLAPEGVAVRRDSSEKKQNRRKRSSPILSLRPNSELLEQQALDSSNEKLPSAVPGAPEDYKIKNQLLQIQLQAALLNQTSNLFGAATAGFPGFPPAPPPSGNPLLYYGYYAQMIQGLQSQQQKLLEQLTNNGKTAKNTSPSTSSPSPTISSKVKSDLLPSPFQTPRQAPSFVSSRLLASTPHSPPSPKYREDHNASPHNLLSSPLSVSTGDEPRRRAPRALTGRYVKSGPGASPRTLAILRKKIEERLKLKELLGENSNLYFGALKQQQKMKPKNVANSRF